MARTPKFTSHRQKTRPGSAKASSKPWNKTPDRSRRNFGHFTRPHPSHASSSRAPRNSYSTPSPPRGNGRLSSDHRKFDLNDDTFYDDRPDADGFADGPSDGEDEEQEGDDDDDFYWEEETTLFSDLLDADPDETKESKLGDLVNSLQPSFNQRGRELKKEIAETLVPTVNHVKGLYKKIETDVDISFGMGIVMFNKACKEMEAISIKDQDEIKHAWGVAQRGIEDLFIQLSEAYKAREQLWSDFENTMNETVGPTLELLRATPAKVERTIASLEKHARTLEKDDGSSVTAAEKKIKGLLGKAS